MDFGKALRTVRASRNISQKELGKLANLDSSYISRIEGGERIPTVESLQSIVEALEIPFYLFMLLASQKEELKRIPEREAGKIAKRLLKILILSQKRPQ